MDQKPLFRKPGLSGFKPAGRSAGPNAFTQPMPGCPHWEFDKGMRALSTVQLGLPGSARQQRRVIAPVEVDPPQHRIVNINDFAAIKSREGVVLSAVVWRYERGRQVVSQVPQQHSPISAAAGHARFTIIQIKRCRSIEPPQVLEFKAAVNEFQSGIGATGLEQERFAGAVTGGLQSEIEIAAVSIPFVDRPDLAGIVRQIE